MSYKKNISIEFRVYPKLSLIWPIPLQLLDLLYFKENAQTQFWAFRFNLTVKVKTIMKWFLRMKIY
jgi:hypothetical protein